MSAILPVLLASLLVPAAQDPAPSDEPQVVIDPGDVLVKVGDMYGRIVAMDADEVTVEFTKIPGSRATLEKDTVPADMRFLYRKAKIDEDSADAWLDLAAFAQEHDLYMRRIDALRAAQRLDPSREDSIEKKIAATRETCAEDRLARARELREAGELGEAKAYLEETIASFEKCGATAKAKSMLDEIRSATAEEKNRATRAQEERQKVRERYPALQRVEEAIDKGRQRLQRGLDNTGDYVESKNYFEDAVALFSRALDRLEQIAGQREENLSQAARQEEQRMERLVRRKLARAHVELGHVYVARGDRESAYEHAGRAAALDPRSAEVSRLRNAIASIGSR